MTDRCITNVGVGLWYDRGTLRLQNSVEQHNPDTDIKIWSKIPNGCLPHKQNPYGFKPYAINETHHQGYQKIFWLDSSVWLNKNMNWAWEQVEEYGYCFFYAGFNAGQWTSDNALKNLNTTREEAFQIPLLCGGIMGLNFDFEVTREFFSQYFQRAHDGSFRGSWTNANQEVSKDEGVLGHRHDQSCASIIAHKLGMKTLHSPPIFSYRAGNDENIKEETIFALEGLTYRA